MLFLLLQKTHGNTDFDVQSIKVKVLRCIFQLFYVKHWKGWGQWKESENSKFREEKRKNLVSTSKVFFIHRLKKHF